MSPDPPSNLVPAVWITRAEPGASGTAARAAALGFDPRVVPLLELADLAVAPEDLEGGGPLAFSSANGVRAFARLSTRRAGPVYVVGPATAAWAPIAVRQLPSRAAMAPRSAATARAVGA